MRGAGKKILSLTLLTGVMGSGWAAEDSGAAAYPESLLQSLFPGGVPGRQKQKVDLTAFSRGLSLAPGVYPMKMRLNRRTVGERKVELRLLDGRLEPVFTAGDLLAWPLRAEYLARWQDRDPNETVFPLSDFFEGVKTTVDGNEQTIDVSLAQRYTEDEDFVRDIAPRALWESGIPAAVVNLNMTASAVRGRGEDTSESRDLAGTLNARVNLGDWRFFSNMSLVATENRYAGQTRRNADRQLWNTYAERDVGALGGSLSMGEITTSGHAFASFSAEGIRLRTNEAMIPFRNRAYTPVIEGSADTEATLLVRRQGRVIQTLNVAPGPFKQIGRAHV